MIRTPLVMLAGVAITVVLGGWLVISSLLRLPWAGRHCEPAARLWARWILRLSGARVRLEGLENLDPDHPYIVVANHQSWFDVFAITGSLPVRFRFVGKEELAGIPIFGRAWTGCGHISLARDDRARAIEALKSAGMEVREKKLAVILFPEGTRSADGRLQEFKKGAFVLAIQTGVSVLPVGISGSRRIMPKGSFWIRPGTITLRVGEPISVDGMTVRDRNALLERGRDAILELSDAPDGRIERVPSDDRATLDARPEGDENTSHEEEETPR